MDFQNGGNLLPRHDQIHANKEGGLVWLA